MAQAWPYFGPTQVLPFMVQQNVRRASPPKAKGFPSNFLIFFQILEKPTRIRRWYWVGNISPFLMAIFMGKQMIIHWNSDSNGAKKWDTYPKWAQFWKLMINHWILEFALLVDICIQPKWFKKMYVKRDTSQVSGQTFIISTWIYLGSWTGREICEMVSCSSTEIYNSDLWKWRIFIHWPSNCRISLSYGLSSAMCPLIWRPSLVWTHEILAVWNFWIVRMWSRKQIQQHVPRDRYENILLLVALLLIHLDTTWWRFYCLAWNRRWSYDKERLDRSLRPSNGSACTMRSHWPWQCWWAASTIFWGHFEASLNVTIFNSPCWLIPFKVWLISYQLIVKSYDLSVKNATS